MKKITYIFILLSLIFILFSLEVKAADPDVYLRTRERDAMASSSSSSKELKETGVGGSSNLNLNELGEEINKVKGDSIASKIINKVLGIVTIIIVTAAIIVIITKGVTFMQAAPEGKAEIKKQMIGVVVGGIIIFGINSIILIIINVASSVVK